MNFKRGVKNVLFPGYVDKEIYTLFASFEKNKMTSIGKI